MSIPFNSTSDSKGIVQFYELEIGANPGDISGSTTKLKQLAAEANVCLDDFTKIAIQSSGKWQFDDSNFTDYPIIYTNLVSGQKDYSFTTDGSGNLILDVYKVMVLPSATSTLYQEVYPIDQQDDTRISNLATEQVVTGIPYEYDKTGNGIFFTSTPNYNATNGIKLMVNREGSYFTYQSTVKMPGVPGVFHKYFYLKPAYNEARRKGLSSFNRLAEEILKLEGDEARGVVGEIATYFGKRAKDERKIMTHREAPYL